MPHLVPPQSVEAKGVISPVIIAVRPTKVILGENYTDVKWLATGESRPPSISVRPKDTVHVKDRDDELRSEMQSNYISWSGEDQDDDGTFSWRSLSTKCFL